MNGNVCKIKGVSAGKTSKFISTIMENAKVRTHKFSEILTLVLQRIFRENVNSENVKLNFHCNGFVPRRKICFVLSAL